MGRERFWPRLVSKLERNNDGDGDGDGGDEGGTEGWNWEIYRGGGWSPFLFLFFFHFFFGF